MTGVVVVPRPCFPEDATSLHSYILPDLTMWGARALGTLHDSHCGRSTASRVESVGIQWHVVFED